MCYSFNTSIFAYTVGMLSGFIALFTNQIVLGLLILCYSQMQLSEAFIWKGIDTNNIELNKMGTTYGKYLLATHNIAIGLGIIFATKYLKFTDSLPLIAGLSFFIFVILFYYASNNYPSTTFPANKSCYDKSCQNAENRLKWPYPHRWYIFSFILSLVILYLYIEPLNSKIFLSSVFIISFVTSMYIYPTTVGSVWCNATAIIAPILVAVNYFLVN
jgi:hypothetical protein